MPGFNFRRREDAENLLQLLGDRNGKPAARTSERVPQGITEGWIMKTPIEGIDARSGTVCGSADCTPYYVDPTGNLAELKNSSGQSQTIKVTNIFSDAIGGDAFVTVKEVFGVLIADAEDCGTATAGGGSAPLGASESLGYGGETF